MDNSTDLHPEIKLFLANNTKIFGPGACLLLKEIERCGNVREACRNCGFSYSKGWTIIKNCEQKLGYQIVERQQGGTTGGTAKVTAEGHRLIALYEKLESNISAYAIDKCRSMIAEYNLTAEISARGDE